MYSADIDDPQVIDAGKPMTYVLDVVQTRVATISVKASSLAEARDFAETLYNNDRISIDYDDVTGHDIDFVEMGDYDGDAEFEPEVEAMRETLGAKTRKCVGYGAVRHLAHGGRCAYKHGLWNEYRTVTTDRAVEILKGMGCAWSWSENGKCVGFHELSWGKDKEGERVLQIAEYNENDLY